MSNNVISTPFTSQYRPQLANFESIGHALDAANPTPLINDKPECTVKELGVEEVTSLSVDSPSVQYGYAIQMRKMAALVSPSNADGISTGVCRPDEEKKLGQQTVIELVIYDFGPKGILGAEVDSVKSMFGGGLAIGFKPQTGTITYANIYSKGQVTDLSSSTYQPSSNDFLNDIESIRVGDFTGDGLEDIAIKLASNTTVNFGDGNVQGGYILIAQKPAEKH